MWPFRHRGNLRAAPLTGAPPPAKIPHATETAAERPEEGASVAGRNGLTDFIPGSVTVAQEILVLFVLVRIQAG